ncbi:unnamed protein product [Durusdinium trenchii]|uniref:Letm1 RBD domain-containing protein n=1 Tax=Durusdinium trenchii TaxID=1381693 RepID=A0ABP0HMP6_9DINO
MLRYARRHASRTRCLLPPRLPLGEPPKLLSVVPAVPAASSRHFISVSQQLRNVLASERKGTVSPLGLCFRCPQPQSRRFAAEPKPPTTAEPSRAVAKGAPTLPSQILVYVKKGRKMVMKLSYRTMETLRWFGRKVLVLCKAFVKNPKIIIDWGEDLYDIAKHFIKWTVTGFKLLGADVRAAYFLTKRVFKGYPLSVRERRLLVRTTSDCLKLIPFSFFLVVPFAEFALPFFLRLFPNMMPSTFFEQKYDNATLARKLKAKQEMADFWQQVVAQRTQELYESDEYADKAEELVAFQEKLTEGKEYPTLKEILRFASIFKDEMHLEKMPLGFGDCVSVNAAADGLVANAGPSYVPSGDVLIHCGDLTNRGSAPELQEVNGWLEELPHRHKLVICGNMDQRLESQANKAARAKFLPAATYLEDEALEVEGLKIYASPFTPKFCGAFQLENEAAAVAKWSEIPDQLDVLVTHGPPYGILDTVKRDIHAGCPELLKRVQQVAPQFHFFGHIHEDGGKQETHGETTFVNAAQHVMVFDVPPSTQRNDRNASPKRLRSRTFWQGHLEVQLRHHITNLRREDRDLFWEGIEGLKGEELIDVCRRRAIRFHGVTEEEMRESLNRWLRLSANHRQIPTSMLLWVQSFYLRDRTEDEHEHSTRTEDLKLKMKEQETVENPEDAFLSLAERQKEAVDKMQQKLEELQREIVEVTEQHQDVLQVAPSNDATAADAPAPRWLSEACANCGHVMAADSADLDYDDPEGEKRRMLYILRKVEEDLDLYKQVVQKQRSLLDGQLRFLLAMRDTTPTQYKDADVILLDQRVRLLEMISSFQQNAEEIDQLFNDTISKDGETVVSSSVWDDYDDVPGEGRQKQERPSSAAP